MNYFLVKLLFLQHLKAKRLQGLALDIEAEELNTQIESSYMNQGQIKADRGTVKINNLHGCTDLLMKEGQVVISKYAYNLQYYYYFMVTPYPLKICTGETN